MSQIVNDSIFQYIFISSMYDIVLMFDTIAGVKWREKSSHVR